MGLRAAAALAPHAAELVVLSSDEGARELGLPLVADAPGGAGPVAGLVAALAHAREGGHAGALLLACDLPLVGPELIGALVEAWSGEDVVLLESGGRAQPLCALWSVSALPAAASALRSADRSLLRLAAALRARTLGEREWGGLAVTPEPLLNVNEEADLARARELLGG